MFTLIERPISFFNRRRVAQERLNYKGEGGGIAIVLYKVVS